ncbi:MAG: hypothetical protein K0Q97_1249 [Bacillota bacterium]|nr:hypothetical protein [Bacillota bacterium]
MFNIKYDLNTIDEKRNIIKNKLFENSANIKQVDFTQICNSDLYLLYKLYDEIFFNSWFAENFKGKITFKFSKQLTRAAGNTTTKKHIEKIKPEEVEFQIKISLNHLFNFDKIDRDKYVGGIQAKSKLHSLMLVFEHEICHVIEFLICKKSSCKKEPFKKLIFNLFGQNESTHKLVTSREASFAEYGLVVGNKVTFEFQGKQIIGIINNINKRATVMSQNNKGNYMDRNGQHYIKYYIPLNCLTKI